MSTIDTPFSNIEPLVQGSPAPTHVLTTLRSMIADGIPPGTRLPSELKLAAQFGVSKNVIREAMKVLASQGFVTVRHGSGTVVNDRASWNVFDPVVLLALKSDTTLEQLIDVRRLLEPEIAYRAAQLADEADLEGLRDMLRTTRRPIEEHVSTDVAFHRRIAEVTGNPVLVILLDSLGPLLDANRRIMYDMEGAVERALEHHRKIYEMVAAGDPDGARAAMLAHIDDIAATIVAPDHAAHGAGPTGERR